MNCITLVENGILVLQTTNTNGTNSKISKNAHRIPPETSEELRDLVLELLTIVSLSMFCILFYLTQ